MPDPPDAKLMPVLIREMRLVAFDSDRRGGGLSAKPSSCAVEFIDHRPATNWSDRHVQ